MVKEPVTFGQTVEPTLARVVSYALMVSTSFCLSSHPSQ